ncbi:hypothetical protein KFE25_006139 [Diacronema lutheri]|uniref:Uncharacterized protein n=1 Tax=Diacronema lutheri TaxID=2081491 RepID=A0A8J5Y1K2_DIALT|nr:hypothetical protein KFE25_006139 [Diacronema lutheri]
MPAAPAAEDAADERVTAKIRAVLAAIALKGSDERWEAVARLRLFCEGASSAEELEEIGSKKWPTLRTLVELLDELSGAPGADAAEARALDDVVWLLECLLCSVTLNHKLFLKQPRGIPLLLGVLERAPLLATSRLRVLECVASTLCCLTFHHCRACQQILDADGCAALAAATRACLDAPAANGTDAQPQPSPPRRAPGALVESAHERLCCSLFELVINMCSMMPQAQAACEATGLFALFVRKASDAIRALPEPDERTPADGAGAAALRSAASSILLEQLLLALNSVVWCCERNQRLLCEQTAALDALLAHVFIWYSWTTQSRANGSLRPPSYLGSLLVLLGAQLDNEAVIGAVARTAHETTLPRLVSRRGSPLARICPLADFVTLHHLLLDQLLDIRHNHQHAEVVADALGNARRLVRHCAEGHYLFVHMHGSLSVEMLLRCLGNVDEGVLDAACSTTAAVLHGSRRTQALFLRRHGISVLRECALDYNARIQSRSLQLLALLAHGHPACRHELRDEGVLRALLRSVQAFPHEMELDVLEPTLDLISHTVTDNPRNQAHVRDVSALGALVEVLCCLADAFCTPDADLPLAERAPAAAETRDAGECRPAPISTADAARAGAPAGFAPGNGGSCGCDETDLGSESAAPLLSPRTPGTPVSPANSESCCGAGNAVGGASVSLWPAHMRISQRAAGAAGAAAAAARASERAAAAPNGEAASAAGVPKPDAPARTSVPAAAADADANGVSAGARPRRRAHAPRVTGVRERFTLARATELACLALNNAIYKQPPSQAEVLAHGIVRPCAQLAMAEPPTDVTAAALQLLINLVDTHARAQALLGGDAALLQHVVALLALSDVHSAPPAARLPPRRADDAAGGAAVLAAALLGERAASTQLRVRMLCCLFLSHLSWNSPRTQAALAADPALVPNLLALIEHARPILALEPAVAPPARPAGGAAGGGARASSSDASSLPVLGAPAMPPALAVGAAAHANPHDGPIELSRYSLMALVNLAYDCALVQERVGSAGGVELLLEILGSNAASLHAAATTCLSNVVKGHAPNAAAAVRAGAARTLVGLVTDDDGDELSKSAFVTLVALDVDGARDLVDALAEALGRVDDALGRADPHDAAQLHDGLYQLLAVLNGLIYTHQPIGKAVLAAHGLERLLGVLQPCRALPAALRVLAVHALLNVTVSRDKPTQDEARQLGALGLLAATLLAAVEELGDAVEQGEACAACYFLLLNLMLNNAASAAEFVACADADGALELLARHCVPPAARPSADPLAAARQPAAEVFLQLCDLQPSQPAMLQRGGAITLRALARSGGMPPMVAQKALSLLSDPQIGSWAQDKPPR